MNSCKICKKKISGRTDKKFCNSYCRSAYHNRIRQKNKNHYLNYINTRIKKNRNILKSLNELFGKQEIDQNMLISKGFDFLMITHFIESSEHLTFRYCYDYGYYVVGKNIKIIKSNP
jgi:hypothetical protein